MLERVAFELLTPKTVSTCVMGKRLFRTAQVRRTLALAVLAAAAALGMGAISEPSRSARRPQTKANGRSAPETLLDRSGVPSPPLELPSIELSPKARSLLVHSLKSTAGARYDEARASCRALIPLTSPAVVTSCVAPIDALTGRYEVARHSLENALPTAGSLEQQRWLYALLGELAYWNGDLTRAEQALGSALALEPDNHRILALHVDLLLDTGRARQALSMLTGQEADDALLLRLALAYRKLDLKEAASASAVQLQGRFDRARARGEGPLARDEARLYLNLPGHERRALDLARASFRAQRKPSEARLLMEAALHARDPKAAEPALRWLARTEFESPELRLLASQLDSAMRDPHAE